MYAYNFKTQQDYRQFNRIAALETQAALLLGRVLSLQRLYPHNSQVTELANLAYAYYSACYALYIDACQLALL